MINKLKELLLKQNFLVNKRDENGEIVKDNNGKAISERNTLFRLQKDISKAIFEYRADGKDIGLKGDEASLRAYVSQILKPPGTQYSKTVSGNMQNVLTEIIKNRIHEDDPHYPTLDEFLEGIFMPLSKHRHDLVEDQIHENFDLFIKSGHNAKRLIALLQDPGEIYWQNTTNTNYDTDLLNRIFENVFKNFDLKDDHDKFIASLINSSNPLEHLDQQMLTENFQMIWCVPTYDTALSLWKALYDYLLFQILNPFNEDKLKLKQVAFHIMACANNVQLDNKSFQFLRIFKVEKFMTVVPQAYSLYVDEHGIEKELLFFLKLNKGHLQDMIAIDPERNQEDPKAEKEKIEFFKEAIYYPLLSGNLKKFGAYEVLFASEFAHIENKVYGNYD